jgi:hypothetical protein
MFWSMLAGRSGWPFTASSPTPAAPAPEPAKPQIGRPDRGDRAQVKASRKAARRSRRH